MLSFVTLVASAQLTYDFNKETGVLTIGGDGTTVTQEGVSNATNKEELKNVVFTATGVTTIGEYAFTDCSALTSITFPDGLTAIGEYAFEYCSSLSSITFLSKIKPTMSNAFPYGPTNRTIYVPNATSGFSETNWGDGNTTLTIKYGEYPTSIEESVAASGFGTQIVNGTLFIQGLKPGTAYTVTNANGSLIAQGIATQSSCQVNVPGHGICIIHVAGKSKKVAY